MDEEKQNFTKPKSIVLRLIAPMLNQGYTLGVDNFYTSPKLIDVLIANQTDCIGNVRFNQKKALSRIEEKEVKKKRNYFKIPK